MKKGFLFKTMRVVIFISLAIVISVLLIALRPKAKRIVREEPGQLVDVSSMTL